MATSINTILSWFKTGLKPSESQFKASWESFWHKDDAIPANSIEDFDQYLNEKADKELLEKHINNSDVHVTEEQISAWNNKANASDVDKVDNIPDSEKTFQVSQIQNFPTSLSEFEYDLKNTSYVDRAVLFKGSEFVLQATEYESFSLTSGVDKADYEVFFNGFVYEGVNHYLLDSTTLSTDSYSEENKGETILISKYGQSGLTNIDLFFKTLYEIYYNKTGVYLPHYYTWFYDSSNYRVYMPSSGYGATINFELSGAMYSNGKDLKSTEATGHSSGFYNQTLGEQTINAGKEISGYVRKILVDGVEKDPSLRKFYLNNDIEFTQFENWVYDSGVTTNINLKNDAKYLTKADFFTNIFMGLNTGDNSNGANNILIGDNIDTDGVNDDSVINIGDVVKGDLVTKTIEVEKLNLTNTDSVSSGNIVELSYNTSTKGIAPLIWSDWVDISLDDVNAEGTSTYFRYRQKGNLVHLSALNLNLVSEGFFATLPFTMPFNHYLTGINSTGSETINIAITTMGKVSSYSQNLKSFSVIFNID